jgi:hypothetical protein
MNNKTTPFQLVSMIKSFGGSNSKFTAALDSSSEKHCRQIKKKNIQIIDDCVKEEAVFNLLLDRMTSTPTGFSLVIGRNEKNILDRAFKQFRESMLNKPDCDIAVYDNAYQQLLMTISE